MNAIAMEKHPLACRCGTVRGFVHAPERANRGLCYCRDCQAYAHFLDGAKPLLDKNILDAAGGTQIVATQPCYLEFTQGFDALACMSLTEKGLLRWYAGCCNTPIGNTPRDNKVAYVGLVHNCLVTASQATMPQQVSEQLEQVFGPVGVVLNTKSATAPVESTPVKNTVAILRLIKSLMLARLTKSYLTNPLFDASGAPAKPVRVLSTAERERMQNAA